MLLRRISAIVLFVQDLDRCVTFYRDTLDLEVTFNDDVSYGFRLGDQDFLVLKFSAAAQMVGEAPLSLANRAGHNVLLCVGVDDVDATYQAFTAKGIAFIRPPIDQAWGRRTAYFADPEGNLWELWQSIASEPQ